MRKFLSTVFVLFLCENGCVYCVHKLAVDFEKFQENVQKSIFVILVLSTYMVFSMLFLVNTCNTSKV